MTPCRTTLGPPSSGNRRAMHVVLRGPTGERELSLGLRNPEATLQDVLRAVVDGGLPERITIDGRMVPLDARALDAGLHEGAVLALGPDAGREPRSGLELVILTGLDAGRVTRIGPGRWTIGRDKTASVTVDGRDDLARPRPARARRGPGAACVVDLGSVNGTLVDGVEVGAREAMEIDAGSVIQLGAVGFAVREAVGRPPARARPAPPHRARRPDRLQPPAAAHPRRRAGRARGAHASPASRRRRTSASPRRSARWSSPW